MINYTQEEIIMAKRIFITATNTDIGKTYTTARILKELASRGLRVGVMKFIETGVVDNKAPDGDMLLELIKELNPEFREIVREDIVPITYELPAAPYVASNAQKLDLEKIDQAVEKIEQLCDVLILEGAGGLYVPVDKEYMIIDLIKLYDAKALLVTHCSLGCINDTYLSSLALKNKDIKHVIAFNCRKDDESFKDISEPYFKEENIDILKVDKDIDTICDVLYNL